MGLKNTDRQVDRHGGGFAGGHRAVWHIDTETYNLAQTDTRNVRQTHRHTTDRHTYDLAQTDTENVRQTQTYDLAQTNTRMLDTRLGTDGHKRC